MADAFKIAIVGSGPSGLSAAAHAAELGVPHVLLESESHPADTIYKYQKGKYVMAEPSILPLRSPLSFAAGTREQVLGAWDEGVAKYKVNLRKGAGVTTITGQKGAFALKLASGETITAEHVILAIGLQGNLRKLGVPGEDLPFVQYQLDDPKEYEDETIIVVGAGDAAIENALALAEQNRVVMINRNDEFARCKEGNLTLVLAAIKDGKLECRYRTSPASVERGRDRRRAGALQCEDAGRRRDHRLPSRDRAAGRDPAAQAGRELRRQVPERRSGGGAAAVRHLRIERSGPLHRRRAGRLPADQAGDEPGVRGRRVRSRQPCRAGGRTAAQGEVRELQAGAHGRRRRSSLLQIHVPLLSGITTLQLREFMLDSDIRTPQPGEIVFTRNDYTNTFYSIVEGEVSVELERRHARGALDRAAPGRVLRRAVADLRAAPRGDGQGRAELRAGRDAAALDAEADRIGRQRAPRDRRGVPEARGPRLPDAGASRGRSRCADRRARSSRSCAAGETLFAEGAAADGLYLIRRGSVTVSHRIGGQDVVLSYVAAGNYVGEMALLSDAPRMGTVKAAVATEAIVLDGARFKEVVARHPKLRETIEGRFLDRIRANVQMESQGESGNVISYLLRQGIGEATDVLLIDESLCVRCDNCEKACADTHDGTSRLNREAGPTYAQLHVPTSCRHCEHPHCMKECPPDAIHRAPNGEVFIMDTCIGCGNCERNCPYGVIQMAPKDPNRRAPKLWSWLLLGTGDEPGREEKIYDKSMQKKAVKCDMCKGQAGGAACVRACPTGAALRVSPERFLDYAGVTDTATT